ncbi:hypothetical protein I6F14_10490 [Bradyrhizobium sp. IC3069]|nr:hypothetical protein [Bradyrhizobium sp. IC3069]
MLQAVHAFHEGNGERVLMLEANHEIIGIAHDNYVAMGLLPPRAFGPEIERVVQVSMARR